METPIVNKCEKIFYATFKTMFLASPPKIRLVNIFDSIDLTKSY